MTGTCRWWYGRHVPELEAAMRAFGGVSIPIIPRLLSLQITGRGVFLRLKVR